MPQSNKSLSEQRVDWITQFSAAERAAISRKARQKILSAICDVAADFGFTAEGNHTAKKTLLRKFSVSIQPSRSGFQCFVNLATAPSIKIGRSNAAQNQDVFRLGHFYDKSEPYVGERGALIYAETVENTYHLDYACLVLKERALPFLLSKQRRHEITAWIAKQPPLPAVEALESN